MCLSKICSPDLLVWFIQDTKGVMESRAPTQNAKESGYLGWAMSSLKTSVRVPMLPPPLQHSV